MSADWLAARCFTRWLTWASRTLTSALEHTPRSGASRSAVTRSEVAIRVLDGTQS